MLKIKKLYLLLAVVSALAIAGTLGGMVFAQGETVLSNQLTLAGDVSPNAQSMKLEWVSVGGGTINGDSVAVTWYANQTYEIVLRATNLDGAISGVYGKLVGWNPAMLKLEYNYDNANGWVDLNDGSATAQACGFFDNGDYYFGPAGTGDSYDSGAVKSFRFRVTPLQYGSVSISAVLVKDVVDPRQQ